MNIRADLNFVPRLAACRFLAFVLTAGAACAGHAAGHYDVGASDSEIRIGNTTPLTGNFAEFSAESRAEAAYFKMLNDHGGINGRKIVYISRDDGSVASKGLAAAHQLVEQDNVLLLFGTFGWRANSEIAEYASQQRIPHLFVQTASSEFTDPSRHPWTIGLFASFRTEGRAYGHYLLKNKPDAKIGVLFSEDETGHEYLAGLKEGLGERASTMIVREAPFSYTNPASIDRQVEAMKAAGADVFYNLAAGRYTTRAIEHAYEIGWRPLQIISNGSLSAKQFIDPAGPDKAAGLISNARSKGIVGVVARRDAAVMEFVKWRDDYLPDDGPGNALTVSGYERAQVLEEVLRRCGDDLTRANVMNQATHLDFTLGLLRPGIRISTSPTDYQPIKDLFLVRFNGSEWVSIGGVER